MDEDARRLFGVLAAIVVLVAAVALWWHTRQVTLPRMVEARVVFRGEGEEVASDRHRVFPPGTRIQVGAVLAVQRGEGPLRWLSPFPEVETRGERLEVQGLDRWPRAGGELRAIWYTVEPSLLGWVGVTDEDAGFRLGYEEFLDMAMGRELVADVPWRSNNAEFLSEPPAGHLLPGGTLRYRVRVSAFQDPRDLFARDAVASAGAEEVFSGMVPAVTGALELPVGIHPAAGRAFRLGCFSFAPGMWPDGGPDWPLPMTPAEMAREFIITTPRSLAALAGGGDPAAEPWQEPATVELRGASWWRAGAPRPLQWSLDVRAGDTLQVGRRYLVLVEDDGDGVVSLGDRVLVGWMEPPRFRPLGLAMPADAETGQLLRMVR